VALRGIRGATTVTADDPEEIIDATLELLQAMTRENSIDPAQIAWAYFTTTQDLVSEFPAVAARRLGWLDVPLMCGHEMSVAPPNPRAIERCIRVSVLYNTDRPASEMRFVYLRGARAIREDLDRMRSALAETPFQ
jgi:chorismate mutase